MNHGMVEHTYYYCHFFISINNSSYCIHTCTPIYIYIYVCSLWITGLWDNRTIIINITFLSQLILLFIVFQLFLWSVCSAKLHRPVLRKMYMQSKPIRCVDTASHPRQSKLPRSGARWSIPGSTIATDALPVLPVQTSTDMLDESSDRFHPLPRMEQLLPLDDY